MYHSATVPSLARVQLNRLRPTQLCVGYAEVELKARAWARVGAARRRCSG
ncbi:MAG: ParB-like protein [Steroidobacteraceae bacterium]